jgi:hypothetical protein
MDIWSKRFSWEDSPTVGRRPAESQTLHIRKTRQARPFLDCNLNNRNSSSCTVPACRGIDSAQLVSSTLDGPRPVENNFLSDGPGNLLSGIMARTPDRFAKSEHNLPPKNYSDCSREPFEPRDLAYAAVQQARGFIEHNSRASCVLCPHISVIAEVAALLKGQRTLWAAIEVSGRLSKLPTGSDPNDHNGVVTGSFIEHGLGESLQIVHYSEQWTESYPSLSLDRYFEYGCLYDLNIDIQPCQGSSVRQVLGEQTFPT